MPDIFTGTLDFDSIPPAVSNRFPAAGATNVSRTTTVSFDITDIGSGVDTTSLDVTIGGVPAIVNGLNAPGYTFTLTPIAGGYTVSISASSLGFLQLTTVEVYAQDLAGIFNSMTDTWSVTTEDDLTAPVLDGFTPADGATNIAVTTPVSFDATDPDSGININSLNLTVGGVNALVNGVTQPGFSVAILPIPNGYHVEAQPSTPFGSLISISSSASAANNGGVPLVTTATWSFQTSDAAAPLIIPVYPASGSTGVSTGSTVFFNITDNVGVDTSLINVLYGTTPVIVNGVFQTNYAGSLTPTPDNTNIAVSIVSIIPFSSYEVVTITAEASDTSGNSSSETWGFQCIDTIAPVIDNQLPAPGSTGVPSNTSIFFRIIDDQSGVDTTTINATVEGSPAIVAGVYQPGFSGMIDPLPTGDGYEVHIHPASTFGSYHLIDVDASAADVDGNTVSASWSFRVEDSVQPSIGSLSPSDGSVDVDINSSVSFDVQDSDSGVNESSIQLTIDGAVAVLNGVIQTGFSGTISAIPNGFNVQVTKTTSFYGSYVVNVQASAQDNEGNTTSVNWSFTTKSVIIYLMRAFHLASNDFVYWVAEDVYDAFVDAPYPESELNDLVLSEVIDAGAGLGVMVALRAHHDSSADFVYWPSNNADFSSAPYPESELSDLVVVFFLPSDFVLEPVLLMENGGIIMQENNGFIIVTV